MLWAYFSRKKPGYNQDWKKKFTVIVKQNTQNIIANTVRIILSIKEICLSSKIRVPSLAKVGKWAAQRTFKTKIYHGKTNRLYRLYGPTIDSSLLVYVENVKIGPLYGKGTLDVEGNLIEIKAVSTNFLKGEYELLI